MMRSEELRKHLEENRFNLERHQREIIERTIWEYGREINIIKMLEKMSKP